MEAGASTGRHALGLLALALVVLIAGVARARTVLASPSFAGEPPEALLRSDPGLLLYITDRIVAGGGLPPADFRADPRVQAPEGTDLAAEFTVGQEFLVAWAAKWCAPGVSLHIVALWVSSLLASAAAVGVYLLVVSRTRSPGWALLAALLFSVLPANSRTLGFVLMREDLAIPLFALHLGLLGWAERRRDARAFLLAGLAAGAALATWFAMGFVFALELGCLGLWFLRGNRSPFEARGAWAALVGPVLVATLVPALRATGFLVSIPMLVAFSLLGVGLARGMGRLRSRAAGAFVSIVAPFVLLCVVTLLDPGRSSRRHVFELLLAKVRLGGRRPVDPTAIPFDARLLWQGPFETLAPSDLYRWIGALGWVLALVFCVLAVRSRRKLGGFDALLAALLLVSLPAAWAVGRLVVLVGLFLPMLAGLARLGPDRRRVLPLVLVLLLARVSGYRSELAGWSFPWYGSAESRREQAELVAWVGDHVPPDEVVAADFVTSTPLLLFDGSRIVLQPKYDTERSRRRIEEYLRVFAGPSAKELARVLGDRFRSTLLVTDDALRADLEWTAGIVPTAEAKAVGYDAAALEAAGFESLYRSPRYRVWRVPRER
ncbi:MAG TPA: hypothetical protein ENJ09_02495 [Planctomycetes bacterium]|nr:hypothetical protein [Planctomycetota bacterium]